MKKDNRSTEKIEARTSYPICKDLATFFEAVMNDRKSKQMSVFNYDVALKYIVRFADGNAIHFKMINGEWIDQFRGFLLNTPSFKNELRLSENSARSYYAIVLSIIHEAIRHRFLEAVVVKDVKPINKTSLKTEALSANELQELAKAECDCVLLKRAFLLSSLTGIQWNEVKLLTSHHIGERESSFELILNDMKDARTIPLSSQAYSLLSGSVSTSEKIFQNLKWNSYLYIKLNRWAIRAGVLRNITFQSARLTFTRLLHEQSISTEIISELLGHRYPKSTLRLTEGVPICDFSKG